MIPSFVKGDKVKHCATGIVYEIMLNADRLKFTDTKAIPNPHVHSVNGYAYRIADHSDNFVWVMDKNEMEKQFIRI